MEKTEYKCPHCDAELERWEPSPYTGWGNELFYCSNNQCAYFITGRKEICYQYEKNFAYRYCYNPENGQEIPIISWCPGKLSLLKDRCAEG